MLNPTDTQMTTVDLSKSLLSGTESSSKGFELLNSPKITQDEQDWLQRPFSEAESLEIIRKTALDKAPFPDGFSMDLFKTCCATLKEYANHS